MTGEQIWELVQLIEYKDWQFRVVWEAHRYDQMCLQLNAPDAIDNDTGDLKAWAGRKWRLSVHMTRSEIVQTALMAVLAAEEHEARELFTYRGERVYSPHYDVEKLVELRRAGDSEELRHG